MNGSENPLEVFSPPVSGGADGPVPRETKKRGFPETPGPRRMRSFFALLFALALVAGCGGEDSSTSAGGENRGSLGAQPQPEPDLPPREPPPQPPSTQTRQPSLAPEPPPAPTSGPDLSWSSGVFSSSRHFRHFCADPSGAFDRASRQGSSVHEKHWLRAWSHETYLWYDEIEDVDPADEHTVSGYFHLMKTGETLSSGARKDNFHFTRNTREYWLLTNSGVSAGYGVRFAIISRDPPREIAVAYVEPGSPASAAGLARGARILEVDGVDVVNGDNAAVINRGLNPSAVGEEHRFRVRDLGASEPRSVSMTSADVTRSPVQHVKVIETAAGERVGYFLFNSHIATAEGQLVSAVNTLLEGEGIDDLVIDLRYNPGGLISVASRLAFMIAGPTATAGKTFARIVRNDKLGDIPTPFYSVGGGGRLASQSRSRPRFRSDGGQNGPDSENLLGERIDNKRSRGNRRRSHTGRFHHLRQALRLLPRGQLRHHVLHYSVADRKRQGLRRLPGGIRAHLRGRGRRFRPLLRRPRGEASQNRPGVPGERRVSGRRIVRCARRASGLSGGDPFSRARSGAAAGGDRRRDPRQVIFAVSLLCAIITGRRPGLGDALC